MSPIKYNKGAKYFSNVEKVLESIKDTYSHPDFKVTEFNEKVLMNMVKGLAAIIDTQNDILKYIVSHDNNANIEGESDDFTPGQFVYIKAKNTFGVVKEIISEEKVKVHVIAQSTNVELLKTEIE